MTKTITPTNSVMAPSRKRVKPHRKTIPVVVPSPSAAVDGEKLTGAEEASRVSEPRPLSQQSLTDLPMDEDPIRFGMDVEHDIWVKMPPRQEFTVKMRLVYEGKAKPNFFADWVPDDE